MPSPRSSESITGSIDEIVARYSDMVYRLAFTKTRTSHDADDVYQEVFLRYIRSGGDFESEEHRKAWFIRVTLNCANKLFSSSWFKKTEPLDENTAELFPDGDSDDYAELRRAIRTLPEKYRDPVILFYCEEMSTADIAAALKISEGNVRVRLTRAREMLKNLLEGGSDA